MVDILALLPRADHLIATVQTDRDAWLAERARGVGGSDVAAILGLSPWTTPLQVWRRKTGQDPDAGSTRRMRRGSHLEAWVRDEWSAATGAEVAAVPFLRDREALHRVASLDGLIVRPGEPRVLEIKTSRGRWDDGLPIQYEIQVRWYLAMTGLAAGLVVLDCGDDDLHETPVIHDPDLAGEIGEAVDRWWADYVVAGVAPEPTTPDERKGLALARLAGRVALATADDVAEAIRAKYAAASELERAAKADREIATAEMAEWMARHGAVRLRGEGWAASVISTAATSYVVNRAAGQYVSIRAAKGGNKEV